MQEFTPADPDYKKNVEAIFSEAPFIQELGITLRDCGPGWVESALPKLDPKLTQQDGFAHAGVIGTLADHSAGASAGTLAPPDRQVLTVEYKLNLLRPGLGDALRCRAEVLKAGKNITVSESWVYGVQEFSESLIAKATVTLALVPK